MVLSRTPLITLISSISLFIGSFSTSGIAAANSSNHAETVKQGKDIVFNRRKGNCLACHIIDDGNIPGNVAPPLVAMKQRYPDKTRLRKQIWNAMETNPETSMPPFGKHQILTEKEIDKVVEYIHSL